MNIRVVRYLPTYRPTYEYALFIEGACCGVELFSFFFLFFF